MGPVRRMLLASTAGGLAGALIASGGYATINPGNSGGPLVDAQGRVTKPIIDRLRGGG